MFGRVESVKILLRANINIQLKNKIGLTALDIAKRTNNIDCSKQIGLFVDGKAIGNIEWFFSLDEDYMSDGMEIEDIDFGETKNSSPRLNTKVISIPSNKKFSFKRNNKINLCYRCLSHLKAKY